MFLTSLIPDFLSEQDPTLAMISRRLSENSDASLPFMESPDSSPSTLLLPTTTPLPNRVETGSSPGTVVRTFKPISIDEIMQWALEHEGPEATAGPKAGNKSGTKAGTTRTVPVTTTKAAPTTTRTVPTTVRPTPTKPTTVKVTPRVVETHRHEGKTKVEESVDEPVKKIVTPVEGVIRVPNPPRVIVPQDQTLPKEVFDRFIHDVDSFHHSFVKEKNGEIPPPFPIHHSHPSPMPAGTLHLFHVPDGNSGIPPMHPLAPQIQHMMRVGEQIMRVNEGNARMHHQRVVDLTPLTDLHEEAPMRETKRVSASRTKVLAHPTSERVSPLVPLPGREEEQNSPGVAVKRTSEEFIPLRHRPAPLRVRVRPIPKDMKEMKSEEMKSEEDSEETTTRAIRLIKVTTAARKKTTTHAATTTQAAEETTTHAATTTHSIPSTTTKVEEFKKKDEKKNSIKKVEKVIDHTKTPVVTVPEMVPTTTLATTTSMTTTVAPIESETESTEETSEEDSSKEEETSTDETVEEATEEEIEETTEMAAEETEKKEKADSSEDYVVISESGEVSEDMNSTVTGTVMKNSTMKDVEEITVVSMTVPISTIPSSTVPSTMMTTEGTTPAPSTESPISIENSTMSSSESEENLSEEDMENSEILSEVDKEVLSTSSNSTSNSTLSHDEAMDMAKILSTFTDLLTPTNITTIPPQFTSTIPPHSTSDTVSLVDFLGALSLDSSSLSPSTETSTTSEDETTPLPISIDEDTPRFLLPPPSQVEEIPNRFRPPDNLDIQLKSMNESITRESRHIDALPLPALSSVPALPSLPSVPSVLSVAPIPSVDNLPSLTPPLASFTPLPPLQHEHESIQSLHPLDASPSVVTPTKKLPLHRIIGTTPTASPTPAPLPLPHPSVPRAIETSAEEGTRPHESASPVHIAPEQAIQGGLEVNLGEGEDISLESTTTAQSTPSANSITESSSTTPSIPLPPSTFQPFPLAESTFAPFPLAESTFAPVPTPAATFAPLPTPSITLAPFPQPSPSLKEEKKEEEEGTETESEYEEEEEDGDDSDDMVTRVEETTTTPIPSTTTTTTTIGPLPVLPDGAGRQPIPDAPVGIAALPGEIFIYI